MGKGLKARSFKKTEKRFDIVVCGAGPAGFFAGIAAARSGKKVALINERSCYGGNSSVEMQVVLHGAAVPKAHWNRFAAETGAVGEFYDALSMKAHYSGGKPWETVNQTYFEMADNEDNITQYLNTTINEVEVEGDKVKLVRGIQMRSETTIDFIADYFIDCTGDGSVSYLAGLDYRDKRESAEEFGESYSVSETNDNVLMGATRYFTSKKMNGPIPYTPPKSYLDLKNKAKKDFPYDGDMFCKNENGEYGNFWWAEIADPELDTIYDDAEIMKRSRTLIYGLWDYIKNSGNFPDSENLELNWISPFSGKRESRRFTGEYKVSELDVMNQTHFDDCIGYTGYPMDCHPAGGYKNPNWKTILQRLPGVAELPLRMLFSKDASNLFFAGRNASATHSAFSTTRVAITCAIMGQAAAIASATCIDKGCTPPELVNDHLDEFNRRQLRMDQALPGRTLNEENDLSRSATVKVSSERKYEQTVSIDSVALDRCTGVILPVTKCGVVGLKMKLESEEPKQVSYKVFTCDLLENYRMENLIKEETVTVDGCTDISISIDTELCTGLKTFIVFDSCEGVLIHGENKRVSGTLSFKADEIEYSVKPTWLDFTPYFVFNKEMPIYSAANLTNGHQRPYGVPHFFSSAKMTKGQSESIEYAFDGIKKVSKVEIVFNKDLNNSQWETDFVSPCMVKKYSIVAVLADGSEKDVYTDDHNYKRLNTIDIHTEECSAIKVVVEDTWDGEYAEVFDVRIYS